MNAQTLNLIERIHASSTASVLVVTGGGAQAISWLLTVPGASRTMLEVLVPYSEPSLAEFLGQRLLEKIVTITNAELMARRAFERATLLADDFSPVIGLGCTAAIATDRPKRGDHRAYVSRCTADSMVTYSIVLTKGLRDREAEDEIVSLLILRALAEASDLQFDLTIPLASPEHIDVQGSGDPITLLLDGVLDSVLIDVDGRITENGKVAGAVLSGSFDPLHVGHQELAAAASELVANPVTFEISVTNVDKPALRATEVRTRLAQFAGKYDVVLMRAPTFAGKAQVLPGCTFVIGYDTAVRLFEPKYYGGDEAKMLAAMDSVRQSGCRFLVAGRMDQGVFRTLADVSRPDGFEDILKPIPTSRFRRDISSTELRLAAGKQD